MMASGEIRLSSTMMRRMPVLAQNQDSNQTTIAGATFATAASTTLGEIVVTAARTATRIAVRTVITTVSAPVIALVLITFPSSTSSHDTLDDTTMSAKQRDPPKDAKDPNGAKAPGKPGAAEGFEDPSDGEAWGQAPNGDWGWVDDDGNVWVPTGQGGSAHGGPHWDVNYPGGGYGNVYPGGGSRSGS
jgi:hypothetical protein